MLGELDDAEKHAQEGLRIRESLNLPDVYKVYGNLAKIARARGDAEAAERWQAKYDAKLAELERLRRGDGAAPVGVPEELVELVSALAQAAYAARSTAAAMPPDAAEALAQLGTLPPPLADVGSFLEAAADPNRPVPPVPEGLPEKLAEILHALANAK